MMVQVIAVLGGRLFHIFARLSLPVPDVQQAVVEHDDILTHSFHGAGKGRDGGFHGCLYLLDHCFQTADQGIVVPNLPVDLTAFRDIACLLQFPGADALMDGGLFIQAALGMAAVVDALVVIRRFLSI